MPLEENMQINNGDLHAAESVCLESGPLLLYHTSRIICVQAEIREAKRQACQSFCTRKNFEKIVHIPLQIIVAQSPPLDVEPQVETREVGNRNSECAQQYLMVEKIESAQRREQKSHIQRFRWDYFRAIADMKIFQVNLPQLECHQELIESATVPEMVALFFVIVVVRPV